MDQKHWSLIVRRHTSLVWRTIFRLLANQADAADCFQETFLCAWELANREPIKNWPALLRRLATSRALDYLRRRHSRAKITLTIVEEIPTSQISPLQHLQGLELAEQLRIALTDLPEQQSQAFCLRHFDGLTYEQIAAEMETTVNAVGINLHRASQRLRAALGSTLTDSHQRGTS